MFSTSNVERCLFKIFTTRNQTRPVTVIGGSGRRRTGWWNWNLVRFPLPETHGGAALALGREPESERGAHSHLTWRRAKIWPAWVDAIFHCSLVLANVRLMLDCSSHENWNRCRSLENRQACSKCNHVFLWSERIPFAILQIPYYEKRYVQRDDLLSGLYQPSAHSI